MKFAVVLNDDLASKLFISFSLSTTNFTATDWTLPADRPLLIFFQRIGEISNPTNLSNTLLACWAFTRFMSILVGFSRDFKIAFLVISLKIILSYSLSSRSRISFRCQAIASPSLSLSVAIYTFSEFFLRFFNSLITFFLSGDGM